MIQIAPSVKGATPVDDKKAEGEFPQLLRYARRFISSRDAVPLPKKLRTVHHMAEESNLLRNQEPDSLKDVITGQNGHHPSQKPPRYDLAKGLPHRNRASRYHLAPDDQQGMYTLPPGGKAGD